MKKIIIVIFFGVFLTYALHLGLNSHFDSSRSCPPNPKLIFRDGNANIIHSSFYFPWRCRPTELRKLSAKSKKVILSHFQELEEKFSLRRQRKNRQQESTSRWLISKLMNDRTAWYFALLYSRTKEIERQAVSDATLAEDQKLKGYKLISSLDFSKGRLYAFLVYLYLDKEEMLEYLANRYRIREKILGFSELSWELYKQPLELLSSKELKNLLLYMFPYPGNSPTIGDFDNVNPDLNKNLSRKQQEIGLAYVNYCLPNFQRLAKVKSLQKEILESEVFYIDTTMRSFSQQRMEKASLEYFENFAGQSGERKQRLRSLPHIESAAVLFRIKDGAILAMVGANKSESINQHNRAWLNFRQISSTIKPFLYARAMEQQGFHPASRFEDMPVSMSDSKGKLWKPGNYYPYFIGSVTLKQALVLSINTISVQLIQKIGIKNLAWLSKKIFYLPGNNIERRVLNEPSLSLGALDLSPLELGKGYLTIAGDGTERLSYCIQKISNEKGKLLYRYKAPKMPRIFQEKTVHVLRDMLTDVILQGTAATFYQARFDFDIAGKSGSSPADSWFVGFNNDYLLVSWAGYDYPMESRQGKLPLFTVIPFWLDIMSQHAPKEKKFQVHPDLVKKYYCRESGCQIREGCEPNEALFPRNVKIPPCNN